MMITIGLMVLFNIAGLATTTGVILGMFGITDPESLALFEESALYVQFTSALALIAAISVITIGVFSRASNITAIFAGVASAVLIFFVGDLISIVAYANRSGGWVGYLAFAIMTPLVFGYVLSVLDWVRGHD